MHVSTFSSVRALRSLLLPGRLSAVPNFLNFTSSLSVINSRFFGIQFERRKVDKKANLHEN